MKKALFVSLLVIVFCSAEAKTYYHIHVYNGTLTGYNYSIPAGDSLMVKAWRISPFSNYIDSTIVVHWYLDSVYQFTAGGMVAFTQPGLIYYKLDPGYSWHSEDVIQLSVTTGINDLTFSSLPYPLSQLSLNINPNTLHYKIINMLGKIIEEGTFSGEIILRNTQPQNPLPPGIYFVIYYDALDNRQVLADKVFVRN